MLRNNVKCRSETSCMSPVRPFVLSPLHYNSAQRIFFGKAVFSRKISSARYAKFLQRNRIFGDYSFQIYV